MPRPIELERCETRDQILKQYEKVLEALGTAGIHMQIIANSYGEGYEKYQEASDACLIAIYSVLEIVELTKANS